MAFKCYLCLECKAIFWVEMIKGGAAKYCTSCGAEKLEFKCSE